MVCLTGEDLSSLHHLLADMGKWLVGDLMWFRYGMYDEEWREEHGPWLRAPRLKVAEEEEY